MNLRVGEQSSRLGFSQRAFTVVELLIVITVIGIIATLVLNTFRGAQASARDASRKNDLAQIKKSLLQYETEYGTFIGTGSGCGANGNGWGWFNYQGGTYVTSIENCLKNSKYLSQTVIDPTGQINCGATLSCFAYMKSSCAGTIYIYAHLETIPQTATDLDSTCNTTWDTSFGMNYFVTIN